MPFAVLSARGLVGLAEFLQLFPCCSLQNDEQVETASYAAWWVPRRDVRPSDRLTHKVSSSKRTALGEVLIPGPFNQLSIGNHGITQFS